MRAGTLAGTVIGWQPERRVPQLRARGSTSDPHVDALVDVACGTPPREGTAEGTPVQLALALAKATCGNCGARDATHLHARHRCPACSERSVAPGDPNARLRDSRKSERRCASPSRPTPNVASLAPPCWLEE